AGWRAGGAEQRQALPARPVTVPSPKAVAKESARKKESGKKKGAARPAPEPADDEDENDEGPTIILLTPSSDAVPLAVAPPGSAALPPRPAEVARFESASKPPAVAPGAVAGGA